MAGQSIMSELWEFLRYRKRYWLWPVFVIMLMLGILVVFTETSAIAPFIYALF